MQGRVPDGHREAASLVHADLGHVAVEERKQQFESVEGGGGDGFTPSRPDARPERDAEVVREPQLQIRGTDAQLLEGLADEHLQQPRRVSGEEDHTAR